MDPYSGQLYDSAQAAHAAGVKNPVLVQGRPEDVAHVSAMVSLGNREQRRAAARQARTDRRRADREKRKELR